MRQRTISVIVLVIVGAGIVVMETGGPLSAAIILFAIAYMSAYTWKKRQNEKGRCDECGRSGVDPLPYGDNNEMPPICDRCYYNPGWYKRA